MYALLPHSGETQPTNPALDELNEDPNKTLLSTRSTGTPGSIRNDFDAHKRLLEFPVQMQKT